MSRDSDKRQIRQAAIVIIAAMVIWMAGSALGGQLGLPVHFAFLLDLAVLAAFLWAIIVLIRIWRRQNNGV
jgi:Na+/citrate or Na+/malate symporter